VFATAQYVWDSEDDAREFLNSPHPLLDGRTPLDVSMTELGARSCSFRQSSHVRSGMRWSTRRIRSPRASSSVSRALSYGTNGCFIAHDLLCA
jgi:Antitoxin Xre/MbcA/ParS C-terminal toxin-binding domain